MTETAIPAPDADGYWHYTYVTYHPDTGEWYGGKHSTNNLNDGYLGSGNWVRNHPTQAELIIEPVEFFYSEEHAYAAEATLVNFQVIEADPLCRNEKDGALGYRARRLVEWLSEDTPNQNGGDKSARHPRDIMQIRSGLANGGAR